MAVWNQTLEHCRRHYSGCFTRTTGYFNRLDSATHHPQDVSEADYPQAIPQITTDFHSLADIGWYGGAYQLAWY